MPYRAKTFDLPPVKTPNYRLLLAHLRKDLGHGSGLAIADHLGIASTTLEQISNGDTAQPQSGGLLMAFAIKRLGLERAREAWEGEGCRELEEESLPKLALASEFEREGI